MSNIFNALGEKFTMSIVNNTAEPKRLALTQGIFTQTCNSLGIQKGLESAGIDAFPVFENSTNYGAAGELTFKSANPKFTISQFQDFLQRQGKQVKQLHVRGNHEDILENDIEVIDYTPFTGSNINYLNLPQLVSVYQQQGNRVVVDFQNSEMKFGLLWSTILLFMLGPGREVTFTFVF